MNFNNVSLRFDDYGSSLNDHGYISVGYSVNGEIEKSGDNDWFAVDLFADTYYEFTLLGDDSFNDQGLDDPELTLFNNQGEEIAYNDDGDADGFGLDSQIIYYADTSGTYYLQAAPLSSNDYGFYELNANIYSDSDVGSSISNHGLIDVGSSVDGELEIGDDLDWFAVELVAGTSYEFTLIGDSLRDPMLTLIDNQGEEVAYNDDGNPDQGEGLDSQIIYYADTSGTYYLQAGSYGDSESGTYELYALLDDSPLDSDNNGFVDDVTNYQMYSGSTVVDLTHRGRTISDQSSRQWDAIKAVIVDNGYNILLEGDGRRSGLYRAVTADSSGEVNGASRWLSGNRMAIDGYEEVFSMDFNGNGVVDLV